MCDTMATCEKGQASETDDPATYVIIEAESGTTEQVGGETVIVVQEPDPIAATEAAPPPPRTVVEEQPIARCPEGIWVDGYWSYGDGQYLWVDGHCVVERVNYVFVQPRWDYYSSVWWFVPGYYRPFGVYVGFGYYRPWHWFPAAPSSVLPRGSSGGRAQGRSAPADERSNRHRSDEPPAAGSWVVPVTRPDAPPPSSAGLRAHMGARARSAASIVRRREPVP